MTRLCDTCQKEIPAGRLEVLPETTTCKACSREKRKVGFMYSRASKGCAAEMVVVDPEDTEQLRLAERANKRRR